MKKAIFFAAFMLVAFCGFSQMDYKFNYQAVVRNGSGALVPSGSTVGLRISILEGSAAGTVLYQETHSALVNNPQGLVNLVIGSGTATVGAILFSGKFYDLTMDKYLQVEVDPSGGTSYTNLGASKLQFVPYAAHAFTATMAENGTQWEDGSASSINYTIGNVNIGTTSPTGSGILNVEKSIAGSGSVLSVKQTNTASTSTDATLEVVNKATGYNYGIRSIQEGTGWGLYAATTGASSGIGVQGTSIGTVGFGVYGLGATGVSAKSNVTNGIAINLDGFMKVSGTKTAFKTSALAASASNITLSYGGAASTDMIFVTPINSSTTMPSWSLIWSGTAWQIWNASDDGIPSNFPAGTSFNILVIKQ